jgi:hypothetical protein
LNPLNDERLALNQKFIDLINEYFNDPENEEKYIEGYYVDAKDLFKHIWHQGYMIVPKDTTIY